MSAGAPVGTAPRSPVALALGRLVLVVSGLGFPITQAVIARFGRRGAVVAEGVAVGLLVRDAALVASGTPRRLRRFPAILLWLELIAAAAATIAGLAAVARPGQVVDRTRAGRAEAVRRFAVGLLFGVHTYRFQVYLRPDRGLARVPEADSADAEREAARPRAHPRPGEEPVEIAPDVFLLGPSGRTQTNVYFVRAGASWVLVDAGWQGDATRIEAAARQLTGPGTAPAAILLTHDHPDHAGAARHLAEAWRCPILLHPAEVGIASGDFAAMVRDAGPLDRWVILPAMRALGERRRAEVLARGSLAGLFRELEPGGTIPGFDGWEWLPTPGHTPGSVSFVRRADRVVLTGDALVTLRVNEPAGFLLGRQGLSAPPWYTTWDGRAAAASIAALAALEPSVVGGGHGLPLAGPETPAAVRAFAARAAVRASRPVSRTLVDGGEHRA